MEELKPLLRLAYVREEGQRPTVASLVEPFKLDSVNIAEFTAQFSDDFRFCVGALLSINCLDFPSPLSIVVTPVTTVGDVQSSCLALWRQRQKRSSPSLKYSLHLFEDAERKREVLRPLETQWMLTWALMRFPPVLYALVSHGTSVTAVHQSQAPVITLNTSGSSSQEGTGEGVAQSSAAANEKDGVGLSRTVLAAPNLPKGSTSSSAAMRVFVVCAPTGKIVLLRVDASASIEYVKRCIEKPDDIPSYRRLTLAGKELRNDRSLLDYNVQNEATLHLI